MHTYVRARLHAFGTLGRLVLTAIAEHTRALLRYTACEQDTFKPDLGSASCAACPDNSVTANATGAADLAQCLCSEGYGGSSAAGCVDCPLGTYKDTTSNSACVACPANSNTASNASTTVLSCTCNAGYFGELGGPCQCTFHNMVA